MKLRLIAVLVVILAGQGLSAQNPVDITNYINAYKELAISEMQRTNIPASIILAQGIHETQAGTSELVKRSNNHFGIKCKDDWTGSVVYHDDDERGECFRSYDNPIDSYRDHSDFLKNSTRYGFLFKLDPMDYESWARGLKKAGYATNPHYSQILIQLIRDYNLQQYTLIAMGKLPHDNQGLTNAGQDDKSSVTRNTQTFVPAKPVETTYPAGEFLINHTRVIFVKSGLSLLSVSEQYDIALSRLIEFNELRNQDVVEKDQLLYLQRKRKTGATEFHIVQDGESLYDICQSEGIRYESILELNLLNRGEEPEKGEKIFLQATAPSKPALMDATRNQSDQTKDPSVNLDAKTASGAASTPPTSVTHIVQTKETLYSIAKKYGVEVENIQKWNKLDTANLKTGQELIIYKN